jgi:hypothetical protein
MRPSKGRNVRQEAWGTIQPCAFSLCDSFTKLICVPINNDGGEKIKTRHAIMLAFSCAVSYFALTSDPKRIRFMRVRAKRMALAKGVLPDSLGSSL